MTEVKRFVPETESPSTSPRNVPSVPKKTPFIRFTNNFIYNTLPSITKEKIDMDAINFLVTQGQDFKWTPDNATTEIKKFTSRLQSENFSDPAILGILVKQTYQPDVRGNSDVAKAFVNSLETNAPLLYDEYLFLQDFYTSNPAKRIEIFNGASENEKAVLQQIFGSIGPIGSKKRKEEPEEIPTTSPSKRPRLELFNDRFVYQKLSELEKKTIIDYAADWLYQFKNAQGGETQSRESIQNLLSRVGNNIKLRTDDDILAYMIESKDRDVPNAFAAAFRRYVPLLYSEYEYLSQYVSSSPEERRIIYDNTNEKTQLFLNRLFPRKIEDITPSPETKGDTKREAKRETKNETKREVKRETKEETKRGQTYFKRAESKLRAPISDLGQNHEISNIFVETLRNLSDTESQIGIINRDLQATREAKIDLERQIAASAGNVSQIQQLNAQIQSLQDEKTELKQQRDELIVRLNGIDLEDVIDLQNVDTRFISDVLEETEAILHQNINESEEAIWRILFKGATARFSDLNIIEKSAVDFLNIQNGIISLRDDAKSAAAIDQNYRNLATISKCTRYPTPTPDETRVVAEIKQPTFDASWKANTQARLTDAITYLVTKARPFLWLINDRRFARLVASLKKNNRGQVRVADELSEITPSP